MTPAAPRDIDLLVPVAVGGVLGALARYALSSAVPHDDPAAWPWATFGENVAGAALLGVLLVVALRRVSSFAAEESLLVRWFRPFAISGVLGGFTTFSALAVETRGMVLAGAAPAATAYAVGSVLAGVLALAVAMRVTGALVPERRHDDAHGAARAGDLPAGAEAATADERRRLEDQA